MDCYQAVPSEQAARRRVLNGISRILRSGAPWRDLPDESTFWGGALYRWKFERGGISVEIDVAGALTLNDQDLMVDAALDGAGLAYVFEGQVEELIAKRKLVRVLADWCPAYPGFFMYYPSRRQLPAALRAFVDFAKTPAPAKPKA